MYTIHEKDVRVAATHSVSRDGHEYVCGTCPFRGSLSAAIGHAVRNQFRVIAEVKKES